jgi:hypothetical protein
MNILDKFYRLANAIQIARIPLLVFGLICFVSIATIVFMSRSHEQDQFLLPGVVGLLWAMSTYAFIATFRIVPEKSDKTWKFTNRLKRNIHRGWYWLVSFTFVGITAIIIFLTTRMLTIWLKEFAG